MAMLTYPPGRGVVTRETDFSTLIITVYVLDWESVVTQNELLLPANMVGVW